ncbi:hypothetical protein MAFF241647_25050 [Ralstonia solanacearum]|nr:hypothetical protein MAFF241647_25050 [Ralstonia solanacearum]
MTLHPIARKSGLALLGVEQSSYYDAQRRLGLAHSEGKDLVAIAVIKAAYENYRRV